MFSLGTGELFLLFLILLLVVGPEKIPTLAKEIARFIHQLKSVKSEVESKISISNNNKKQEKEPK